MANVQYYYFSIFWLLSPTFNRRFESKGVTDYNALCDFFPERFTKRLKYCNAANPNVGKDYVNASFTVFIRLSRSNEELIFYIIAYGTDNTAFNP